MSKQLQSAGDAPGINDASNLELELSLPITETPTSVENDPGVKIGRKLTFDDPESVLVLDVLPFADRGGMSEVRGVSPLRSRPEDTPEDRFLNALLDNNLPVFEDILKSKSVKLDHRYHRKPYFGTILEIATARIWGAPYVQLLLQNNVRPNVHNVQPEPIHHAARKGFPDILHTLLSQRNIKAFAIDGKGRTALHLACLNINPERKTEYIKCIKMLMKKLELADINRPDVNGFTAFHALLRGNQPRSIKGRKKTSKKRVKLTTVGSSEEEESEENSVKLRSKGNEHKTREHAAKVMLQESRGALDVDSCCARGMTARDEVERCYPELKRLLPLRRDILRADPHTPLVDAIRDGRIGDFIALLQQTDSDGYPVLNPNYTFEEPLHANCLELACRNANGTQFVQALLEAGADPNVPNQITYDFPIHVTCDMGNYASLKVLLDYQADANFSDKSGNTPLHRVVEKAEGGEDGKEDWLKCFDVLLDVDDLDVNRKNDEENTPLMIAVRYKNMSIIRKALYDEKHAWEFDVKLDDQMVNDILPELFTDEHKMEDEDQLKKRIRPTIKARSRFPESSKVSSELFGLLYQGKEEEFVHRLHEIKQENLLPSLSINDGKFTLLQHSAHYQHVKATQALLNEGALPNDVFLGNRSPPLVLAVCSKSMDVIKILLENPFTRVNDTDDKGYSPLHFASRAGNLEMVILLMRHGADLNAMNKFGKPPFDEKNAKALLDQCIHTNKKNLRDENYVLTFDYRLLAPGKAKVEYCNGYCPVPKSDETSSDSDIIINEKVGGEMDFLDMLRENEKMSDLLNHPVAWSFLQLKWKRVKGLTYINLIVYIFFILFLYAFIVCSKKYPLNRNGTYVSESLQVLFPLAFITMCTWGLVFFRELLQFGLDTKIYFYNCENYVDWGVLISSFLSVVLPFTLNFTPTTVAIINYVDVFTIMLSCTELLILLGRLSWFATNIEMLKVVMKSYALPLLSYCVIIIAFGLSFHTLCQKQGYRDKTSNSSVTNKTETNHFESWYMSIVKTLVMMTGELEFDSFPNISVLSVVVFAVFVLVVTLVLLNLLTGVAVSDTQRIRDAAKRLRLQTRVGVVMRIERTLLCCVNGESALARCVLWPRPLRRCLRRRLRRALLFANAREDSRREGCVKPNVDSKVGLCSGDAGEGPQLDREAHESVMRILSERSAAAAPCTSLDDVDVKVIAVLNMVRDLRSVILAAVPGVAQRIRSSVSSRGEAMADWDIDAPVFSGRD